MMMDVHEIRGISLLKRTGKGKVKRIMSLREKKGLVRGKSRRGLFLCNYPKEIVTT